MFTYCNQDPASSVRVKNQRTNKKGKKTARSSSRLFGLGHVFFNESNPFSKPKVKKKQTTNKTEKDSNPKEGRKKEEGRRKKEGRVLQVNGEEISLG